MLIKYVAFDEGMWETSVKERHATIGREGISSTVNRNLRDKRGVDESIDTPDDAGAMFWSREGGVDPRRDPRRDIQDLGAAVRRRVRKTGRKLRRRTWASVRLSPRVRRR